MSEVIKRATIHNTWFIILSSIAVCLIIISFFTPPYFVIHASVIAAVGEIFAFTALWCVYKAIDKGHTTSIQKGDIALKIEKKREED